MGSACAACGADNTRGARFCTSCGAALIRRCPACGEACDPAARFCGACGNALTQGAHAERVPDPRPEDAERKLVSVLFVDLVGFTAASDAADPEDVQAILAPYHDRAKAEIERFGGVVQKFIGDAVVATFGVPTAREDDAERAVRAGLTVLAAVAEDGLSARAAVNTGEALILVGADPSTGAHFLAGDAVNTAARMQAVAPEGGVVVGEATFRATRQRVEYEPLEAVEVKGKRAPLALWRATAARGRAGSDVAGAPAAPFVGRDRELQALRMAMRAAIADRRPHAVTVIGEPGVGKSRLLRELRQVLDADCGVVTWRVGRCLPYGEGVTFWALGEIVKAEAGILESDGRDAVADVLERTVAPLVGEVSTRAWVVAHLTALVGADAAPAGAGGRTEAFAAWRSFLEAVTARGPLVVVVEDLHWADVALVEFLDYLVGAAENVPLVIVATARPDLPERHPSWLGARDDETVVHLAPLGRAATAQLISRLLSGALLPAETQAALIQRTGGNPLFAEELVGMVTERGILEDAGGRWRLAAGAEIPVPETIELLIAARLDDLTRTRKALLQAAAVIGEVFWSGAVAAMESTDEREVLEALHALHGKGLIRPVRESSISGHVEYAFAHALVREVAYRQIPRATRARRHRAAARWIEGIGGDHIGDHAELIAHHWLSALELARAARSEEEASKAVEPARRYLLLAAHRLQALDPERAVSFCEQALEITPTGDPDRAQVLLATAAARLVLGDYEASNAAAREALEIHREAGDIMGQGRALLALNAALWGGDKQTGRPEDQLSEAIGLLRTLPPSKPLADAYRAMAGFSMISGDPRHSVAWSDRCLALAAELGLDDVAARVRSIRGMARVKIHDAGGLEDLREALAAALEGGLADVAFVAYSNLAEVAWWVDGPAEGLQVLRAGIDFAERRGLRGHVRWHQESSAGMLFDAGRWQELLELAGELIRRGGDDQLIARSFRAAVLVRRESPEAPAAVADAMEVARRIGDPYILGPALTVASLLELQRGDADAAMRLMSDLWTLSRRQPTCRAQELADAARICVAAGQPEVVHGALDGVTGAVCERHRAAIAAARATLAEASGDTAAAAEAYERVAARWERYGHRLEHAHALLGAGRCRVALGDAGSAEPLLRGAAAVFDELGVPGPTAEAQQLLAA